MKPRLAIRFALAMACASTITACQLAKTPGAATPDLQRQLADSRAVVRHYEERYGNLSPERPEHGFRKLRTQLVGMTMKEVAGLLGRPASVFVDTYSESWDYLNVTYDPVSERTVRELQIWFNAGVVEDVTAHF
jgi:outer membrane protein assembly factor BamE (lipoprotein component of BamABCDE complex)